MILTSGEGHVAKRNVWKKRGEARLCSVYFCTVEVVGVSHYFYVFPDNAGTLIMDV
jgi:hypothetical protein